MKRLFRIAGILTLVAATALLVIGGSAASVPVRSPGYWLEAGDGGIFAFGGAPFFGSATQQCTLECFGFGATGDGRRATGVATGSWTPIPQRTPLSPISIDSDTLRG